MTFLDKLPDAGKVYAGEISARARRLAQAIKSGVYPTIDQTKVDSDGVSHSDIKTIHGLCCAFNELIGDNTYAWNSLTPARQAGIIVGANNVLTGEFKCGEDGHKDWTEKMVAQGYTYAPETDPAKKQHKCMLPYAELPEVQRWKDSLFAHLVNELCVKKTDVRTLAAAVAALGYHYRDPAKVKL